MISKKYLLLFILIFFLNCNSKNTNSFISLKKAYIDWHFSNHLTLDFDYTHNYFKHYNQKFVNEYIEDLNRFDLELSQINLSNLSNVNKTNYYIIKESIDDYLYVNNKVIKKTSLRFLEDIKNSIYFLYIRKDLPDFEKIISLENHLDNVLFYFRNYEDIVSDNYKNIKFINDHIEGLVFFLQEIPYTLNVDNNSKLNDKIKELVSVLYKFKYWYNYDIEIKKSSNYNLIKVDFDNFINKYFSSSQYDYNSIIDRVHSNITSIQNLIFNESLNLYLLENDEPVWVDREDTVNVIKWVLNKKINVDSYNQNNLLPKISEEYNFINNTLDDIGLVNYYNYPLQFTDTLKYYSSSDMVKIFNDIVYININNLNIYFNKYTFNDLLFDNVIADFNVYKSFYNCDDPLRRIENIPYNKGFTLLLKHIMFLNHFNNDSLYKINFYLNLLRENSLVFNQNMFMKKNISKNKIITNFEEQNFISNEEASRLYNSINSDEYHIQHFIIYLHLLQLYEEKCILSNVMKPAKFIDLLLSQGYVPYYLNN